MASLHEKLAESLKVLRELQDRGVVVVRSGDLTRTHQERLVKNGFLQDVRCQGKIDIGCQRSELARRQSGGVGGLGD